MRIDLHVHTKDYPNKKGERYISKEDFLEKMQQNEVGMVSATNHYKFDKTEFIEWNDYFKSQFVKEEEDAFLFLPGVELNIKLLNGNTRHTNIICSPDEVDKFDSLITEIENSQDNPLLFKSFIEKFDIKNFIIYLDHKSDNRTKWKEEEIKDVQENFKEAVILADANNAQTQFVLNSHNVYSLIGSDVKDWDCYGSAAKKLIDTSLKIKDYKKFWAILKQKPGAIDDLFNDSPKEIDEFEMPQTTKKYTIKNLRIYPHVNVIFGDKATGKSEILKAIEKQIIKGNCVTYAPTNIDTEIEDAKQLLTDKNKKNFNDIKQNFENLINKLKNYKEDAPINLTNFYKFFNSPSVIKFHNFENFCGITKSKIDEDQKEDFLNLAQKLIDSIRLASKIFDNSDTEISLWMQSTKQVLEKLWSTKYVPLMKDYWKYCINSIIYDAISSICEHNKGQKSKPSEVGLYKRYCTKREFLKTIQEIKKHPKEYSKKVEGVSISIPKRGDIKAKYFLNFIEIGESSKNDFSASLKLKKKTPVQAINKKIKKIDYESDLVEIQQAILEIASKTDSKLYIEHVDFLDKNDKSNFSSGEKAYFILFLKLEEDVQYYLLDEPEVFLSSTSLSEKFLDKIFELSKAKKSIVIVTHNSFVGLNTIPRNYIFREFQPNNDECTTFQGSIWEDKFKSLNHPIDKMERNFVKTLIDNFENGKEFFDFRKHIYEST